MIAPSGVSSAGFDTGSAVVGGGVVTGGCCLNAEIGSDAGSFTLVSERSIFSFVGSTACSGGVSANTAERGSRDAYHHTARPAATTRPDTTIAPGIFPRGRVDVRNET